MVIDIITKVGFKANALKSDDPKGEFVQSARQMVRDSSAYVGILTTRLGLQIGPGRLSVAELEIEEAARLQRPILLFIIGEEVAGKELAINLDPTQRDRLNRLDALRMRVTQMVSTVEFHEVQSGFVGVQEFSAVAHGAILRLIELHPVLLTPA